MARFIIAFALIYVSSMACALAAMTSMFNAPHVTGLLIVASLLFIVGLMRLRTPGGERLYEIVGSVLRR